LHDTVEWEAIGMAEIAFTLNGKPVRVATGGDRMLLWVLRADLGLTGAKFGCGQGICGACAVLVDGKAVRSCTTPVDKVAGKAVVTIEGLAKDGKLHPLQEAFAKHDALQCGFCTPGMILTAADLLARNPKPSQAEIVRHMDNNLCRCGAHNRIVQAIQSAAAEMAGR
jgi:aerobic-type carbon monoxide dehydrogenase small subunit (CoxS/CutS family)